MNESQKRTMVTIALLLSNIMTGMDATIVNTALPAITGDLHGLAYMGWIVATFLLGLQSQHRFGVSLVSIVGIKRHIFIQQYYFHLVQFFKE